MEIEEHFETNHPVLDDFIKYPVIDNSNSGDSFTEFLYEIVFRIESFFHSRKLDKELKAAEKLRKEIMRKNIRTLGLYMYNLRNPHTTPFGGWINAFGDKIHTKHGVVKNRILSRKYQEIRIWEKKK